MNENIPAEKKNKTPRGWLWWVSRILIALVVIHIGLLMIGFVYETIASKSDHRRYPLPGKLIEIDGHLLHIHCTGESAAGKLTVIIEAGAGSSSPDWGLVQPEVAKFGRVCSYDRAGFAWSEPGPLPPTSRSISCAEMARGPLRPSPGLAAPVRDEKWGSAATPPGSLLSSSTSRTCRGGGVRPA